MCITFFYFPQNPEEDPLFIAFNRDESALRLTVDLHKWDSDPNLIAGTDTVLKGTWFGINTKTKNIAYLTNLEDPLVGTEFKFDMRSRGELIRVFLESSFYEKHSFEDYLDGIIGHCSEYNPFNPVFGNYGINKYYYVNIVDGQKKELPKNTLLGFSNNLAFCNKWQKVDRGVELLSEIDDLSSGNIGPLLGVMHDRERFGVTDPKEESSIFIDPYFNNDKVTLIATVSTSVLFIKNNKAEFHEYRKTLSQLEKVRNFMLTRKASIRLKNYFRFIMFMMKEPGFESTEHSTVIKFQLD